MMMGTKKYNISQLCCGLFIRLSRSEEEKGKEDKDFEEGAVDNVLGIDFTLSLLLVS